MFLVARSILTRASSPQLPTSRVSRRTDDGSSESKLIEGRADAPPPPRRAGRPHGSLWVGARIPAAHRAATARAPAPAALRPWAAAGPEASAGCSRVAVSSKKRAIACLRTRVGSFIEAAVASGLPARAPRGRGASLRFARFNDPRFAARLGSKRADACDDRTSRRAGYCWPLSCVSPPAGVGAVPTTA